MRLGMSKAARALLMLPLALSLQAQRAPEDCRAWTENGVHTEPILLLATQRGLRTQVQNGAVVAEEVMQIATEGWMLQDELRLADEGLVFPAGTALDPDHASREPRCLPLAPSTQGEEEWRGFRDRGRLTCLADADGDGRFEQVKMYGADYAIHVPRARLYSTITLTAPIALAADPLGNIASRRRVTRRLTIGTVDGDSARFILRHSFGERLPRPARGRWDSQPGGGHVYRLPPPVPVPLAWTGHDPSANSLTGELVRLVEGQTIEVGGLSLVVEEDSPSFPGMLTVRSTTPQFPRWLHFGCGGRSVRAGAESD